MTTDRRRDVGSRSAPLVGRRGPRRARPRRSRRGTTVDRVGYDDLLQSRATTRTAEVQVGGLMLVDTDDITDLEVLRRIVAERIQAVTRLRQRLVATPPGCGRPVWVDDAGFDVAQHVTEVACPAPGDMRALLDLAARLVTTPLPAHRPLWSLTVVPGDDDRPTALVLVFHHVLADGIGGLAVLAHLVDGNTGATPRTFPRPPPTRRELATEAARSRLHALAALPRGVPRLLAGLTQLRAGLARAPRSSLNRPTGPTRRLAVVRTDLDAVRAAGRAHGATVNDVLLVAIAAAVRAFLHARGEELDRLVVSMPVSAHTSGEADAVRNATGVVPVVVPTVGAPDERLAQTARRSRRARSGPRGATTTLLGPLFSALAAVGAVRWYINRQQRVNTFVTNMRGPGARLRFMGAEVSDVIALTTTAGNVSVAFGALSYAGALTITVVADPSVCGDVDGLAGHLQREFDELTAAGRPSARR